MTTTDPSNLGSPCRMQWAKDEHYPAGAYDWSGENTKVTPTSDMTDHGWHGDMQYIAEVENYINYRMGCWIDKVHDEICLKNLLKTEYPGSVNWGSVVAGAWSRSRKAFGFVDRLGYVVMNSRDFSTITEGGVGPEGAWYLDMDTQLYGTVGFTALGDATNPRIDFDVSPGGYMFAIGNYENDNGWILTAIGGAWTRMATDGSPMIFNKCAIMYYSGSYVYIAAGVGGKIGRSTGSTFALQTIASFGDVIAATCTRKSGGSGEHFILTDGTKVATSEDGSTWTTHSHGLSGTLLCVCATYDISTGDRMLVGLLSNGKIAYGTSPTGSPPTYTWSEASNLPSPVPSSLLTTRDCCHIEACANNYTSSGVGSGASAVMITAMFSDITTNVAHGWVSTDGGMVWTHIHIPCIYMYAPAASATQFALAGKDSSDNPIFATSLCGNLTTEDRSL